MISNKFHKADPAQVFLMDFALGVYNFHEYLRVFIPNRNDQNARIIKLINNRLRYRG
jgi:hypothetical protein